VEKRLTTLNWTRNVLAAVGALALVALALFFVIDFVGNHGLCEKSYGNTASVSDAKASVYQFDCGAMGATRTYVMLSNPAVEGWKNGDSVLVLLGVGNPKNVEVSWKGNRRLHVAFPGNAEIEFAVAKTRGISIELEPFAAATPNEARR
jgi:hypothetical protein